MAKHHTMKNLGLILAIFCSLFATAIAQQGGTGQPMSDKIVGYWVSSTGTPLTISYSGKPELALLSIANADSLELWLAGGARGGITLDYTSKDGTKMTGQYNESEDTISVHNESQSFKATWRRRKT